MIKSRLSDQVLSVEENACPRQKVVTYPLQKNWDFWGNQLWYDDHENRTIRSKQHGHCLDVSDGSIAVRPHDPCRSDQRWERSGDSIRNCNCRENVVDISGSDRSHGAKVICHPHHGGNNQKFDFLEVPGFRKPFTRREFFIVSEMNGKVLDICGGNSCPGALVIVWPRNCPPSKNQLWYFDNNGIIHSALNDLVPQSQGAAQVKMVPLGCDNSQHWTVVGNRIVSKTGECLDIRESDDRNGAEVISYGYFATANQHWRLEYV